MMSLHYIFPVCKKVAVILETGRDGDQTHNSYVFGTPPYTPSYLKPTFPHWHFLHMVLFNGESWDSSGTVLSRRKVCLMGALGHYMIIILSLMRSFCDTLSQILSRHSQLMSSFVLHAWGCWTQLLSASQREL